MITERRNADGNAERLVTTLIINLDDTKKITTSSGEEIPRFPAWGYMDLHRAGEPSAEVGADPASSIGPTYDVLRWALWAWERGLLEGLPKNAPWAGMGGIVSRLTVTGDLPAHPGRCKARVEITWACS